MIEPVRNSMLGSATSHKVKVEYALLLTRLVLSGSLQLIRIGLERTNKSSEPAGRLMTEFTLY